MQIQRQIEEGKLRCVKTGQKLVLVSDAILATNDGTERYPIIHGVPHVLADSTAIKTALNENEDMVKYYARVPSRKARIKAAIFNFLCSDYRSKASKHAFAKLLEDATEQTLVLSIGGGPVRQDERLTNLNIGRFHNVDIVGDAHVLPYMDQSVDAIYSEAVLEHLSDPQKAVVEMYRVLKPGGKIFTVVPFLIQYHGYPNHFQNFTLHGHMLLLSKQGFTLLESGTCAGPINALATVIARGLRIYIPGVFGSILQKIFQYGICLPLRPLDRLIEKNANSYMLAASTYVLAVKP